MWRDLFAGCIGFFRRLFYEMEDEGLMSANDVYALHTVFLPVIQDVFREGWAHDWMRTCTPYQMWIQGLLTTDEENEAVGGVTQVLWFAVITMVNNLT